LAIILVDYPIKVLWLKEHSNPPVRGALWMSAYTQGHRGNAFTCVVYQMPDIVRIDRLKFFLDSMGGGAWPFLVGGVICLVS
jgi:hypothetical protein